MKISLVSIPVRDPSIAHKIYTTKLGFISREFDPANFIAVVSAPDDPDGTAILLEPCEGNFAEDYQKSAFKANLPIIVFSSPDPTKELQRLSSVGITVRSDLDRPDWGITNLFEDGCGNLIMINKDA